jgi:hypothetical protein
MGFDFLRPLCLFLSAAAILAGGGGLWLSYAALQYDNYALTEAAGPGFIAGAVLIGSGLISLAVLVGRPCPHQLKGL